MTSGARDFYSGLKLTADRVRDKKIDSHHVFPKAYLNGKKDQQGRPFNAELILNRALIDPVTNKAIGSKAPSEYFRTLRETQEEQELIEIMRSHLIDADDLEDPFRHDDYTGFVARRLDDVVVAIEGVTGCKVVIDQGE